MSRYGYGYGYGGGRDWVKWKRGGRWEDNDEGYYWAYCPSEGRRTEHENGECCSCANKRLTRRR